MEDKMKSRIAEALRLQYEPIAVLWSDEKPEKALQFAPGRRGCVMWLVAQAAKGKTAVFDRDTFGCYGGGVALGFGDCYASSPLGREGFLTFLSHGTEENDGEIPKDSNDSLNSHHDDQREILRKGERYWKTPALVQEYLDEILIMEIPVKYVIVKPLLACEPDEIPKVVIFFANPHQISGLITLVNYARPGHENVIIRAGSGCNQAFLYAYQEGLSACPRAVLGFTDPSARKNCCSMIGDDALTLAVPYPLYQEMEDDVKGSFLETETWEALQKRMDQ